VSVSESERERERAREREDRMCRGGVEFSFKKEGNGIEDGVLRYVKSYYRCCCGHDDLICFVQIQVWHPGQLREVQGYTFLVYSRLDRA